MSRQSGARSALEFVGEFEHQCGVPLRQHARVHEQHSVFRMHERAMADPVEQRVGVGVVEDFADGVARALGAQAGGDRKQVEVVIAEHDGRARAEVDERTQRGEGAGAAIDDVAGDPERGVGRRRQLVEQRLESGMTALDVADCDGGAGHER